MSRAAAWPLQAALALAMAACATAPPVPPVAVVAGPDAPFAIDGRMSARHGKEAIAIAFTWTHAPPRDELVVSNPMGQTIAEFSGDASTQKVEMRTADGRRAEASDWPALTERAIGVALPVAAIASWAQGRPRAETPHTVESDASGRALVLRQDGCEIVYAYADDSAPRPSRLTIACFELDMRVVIDRWRAS
jgi:outer membrane lipoprotein LolB